MVIHSAYLNVHTHSCLYKLEKCRSRAVTYYNKKGQTQGGLEYKTLSDLSSETILPCSNWHEIYDKDTAEIRCLKYKMIRPKLVPKSNHQNNGLSCFQNLGEGNTNSSEC